jgi:hypothetical protein
VMIRVWIVLIASDNIIIEVVGGAITFLLLVIVCMRYRCVQDAQRNDDNNHIIGINNPEMAYLQSLFRAPHGGLSQEMIDSMNYYEFRARDCSGSTTEHQGIEESGGNLVSAVSNEASDLESAPAQRNRISLHLEDSSCSICLAEYVHLDSVISLPCHHLFHRSCVTSWLLGHRTCPLCKQDVMAMIILGHEVQPQPEAQEELTTSATAATTTLTVTAGSQSSQTLSSTTGNSTGGTTDTGSVGMGANGHAEEQVFSPLSGPNEHQQQQQLHQQISTSLPPNSPEQLTSPQPLSSS